LIADRDGVYDPTSINGRLLLGLKGQISELELHTIRARLTAGILSKAGRGELALTLPTGLVRLADGRVVKHPDQEVQDRIALVFSTLFEKKSIAQVVREFRRQGLKLPRQDLFGDLHWRRPTVASIGSLVKNPAYAGAFVYGRTRWQKSENTGKYRGTPLPQEQWRVCVHDKYPAYISWQTFERIQHMLRDNYAQYDRNQTRGVPRDGQAVLQGIAYCGECGHKLVVQYQGGSQYLCNQLRQQQGEPVCQRLPAEAIDRQVVTWFFEALSPAEIDLSARLLEEADCRRDGVVTAWCQQVQRLQYQARLAERQYQHADPENRLVAAELERRWEAALGELREAQEKRAQEEQQAPCWAIPVELLDALRDLGPRLPELWEQRLLSTAQKKSLLRSLIDKVVLQRVGGKRGDKVHVRVVWRGGATTCADVPVTVGSFAQLSDAKEMEASILSMARDGQSDEAIATALTAQGHRSPMRHVVLPSTVRTIRLSHRILQRASQSHPRRVAGFLTIPQLAAKLNLPTHWISDRIHNGLIPVEKDARTQCYLFPDHPDTLRQFRQLRNRELHQVGSGKEYQDA
jgi:hypothetical protein